jgi:hypothetical protein
MYDTSTVMLRSASAAILSVASVKSCEHVSGIKPLAAA